MSIELWNEKILVRERNVAIFCKRDRFVIKDLFRLIKHLKITEVLNILVVRF